MRRIVSARRKRRSGKPNGVRGSRVPPSASGVSPLHRQTTKCIPYMCVYAYGCAERPDRAAQVLTRRCMRYMPDSLRVKPKLSDFALDLLARRRQRGEPLSGETTAILDEHRPKGPIRRVA